MREDVLCFNGDHFCDLDCIWDWYVERGDAEFGKVTLSSNEEKKKGDEK